MGVAGEHAWRLPRLRPQGLIEPVSHLAACRAAAGEGVKRRLGVATPTPTHEKAAPHAPPSLMPYPGALVRLRAERGHEDQGVAAVLGPAELAHHGRNQHRVGDEVRLDVGDHRRLVHILRNPTVRHRRTGVAINGLVSGKKDGPPFL